MEDHHQNHDQNHYGIDLRQFVNSRIGSSSSSITPPFLTTINPHHQQILGGPAEAFTMHRINVTPQQSNSGYDMMMLMPPAADTITGLHKLRGSDGGSTTTASTAAGFVISPSSATVGATTGLGLVTGLDVEGNASFVGCGGGGDGGNARWPRQETLTLLEIRSRLDYKFKEANQKGPLWDEVSRLMCEEYGYQRSGKKCREKFENLYKYYKKTKEGKAGRHDGKHYRFFRQLEALCGDQTNQQLAQQVSSPGPHFLVNSSSFNVNNIQEAFQIQSLDFETNDKPCESFSLSCSSGFNTSSSGGNDDGSLNVNVVENIDSAEKRRRKSSNGKSGKKKIKDFIDMKIGKLMERQEAWLEKLTTTLEEKEKERAMREELWRKQEVESIERAHKLWAKERSWIEARDAALMDAFQNITGRSDHHLVVGNNNLQNENGRETIINLTNSWPEPEVTRLIQLRTSMDSRFQQGGCREDVLWEEIAAKMSCPGYERSGLMCKQKWDCISNYMRKNKKLPNSRSSSSCYNFQSCNESVYNPGDYQAYNNSSDINEQAGNHVAATNVATSDSSFRFMISNEGHENLWENYGLKLSRGDRQS